jgi:hypothetical protein
MSENPLRSELSSLERKLILLLSKYNKQKNEIQILERELEIMKAQVSQQEVTIIDFQNKDKISKIVNGMVTNESDPSVLSEVLSEYIKEVDKCIAQLSE